MKDAIPEIVTVVVSVFICLLVCLFVCLSLSVCLHVQDLVFNNILYVCNYMFVCNITKYNVMFVSMSQTSY